MHDGAKLALIFITDLMKNQAIAHMKAHTELPLLPLDEIALNFEARPLRLSDLKRLHIAAGLGM